jgi:flavin-dependent dehydrogenase
LSGPVVIGGGPAGSTAAITLARAWCPVTLLERHAGPADKVCGDFLSAEATAAIKSLGVDPVALGAAPISAIRLVHGTRTATARLPFAALGLTRRALDEALLLQAQRSGATVLRGRTVRRIERGNGSLRLDCGPNGPIDTTTAFLATGKHALRGTLSLGPGSGLVGLKMYFALAETQLAALRDTIELVLFPGGYAGLQLVEADRAVLCLLVPGERLRAARGRWHSLLDQLVTQCPHLADRLSGARPLLDRPLAIAGLPYGHIHRRPDLPGLFRLGDQAAVIPSFTGDGVALALASGCLAARTWLGAGHAEAPYRDAWVRQLTPQMRLASLIHAAARSPALQGWLVRTCAMWPAAMRWAAARTRLRAAFC